MCSIYRLKETKMIPMNIVRSKRKMMMKTTQVVETRRRNIEHSLHEEATQKTE